MKIALINPPSPFLTDERVFPNVGLVRLATQLEADGHRVQLFDITGVKDYLDFANNIDEHEAFLFSSTTPQFPYTYEIFKKIKNNYPYSQFIIGGAHASAISSIKEKGLYDENILALEEFDTVFNGEGEDTEKLFEKGWITGSIINDIDDTLLPDMDFIDLLSYKYKLFDKPTTSIQTQRGCPHQCAFCCGRDIAMYNHVRFHSPERVLEEMDALNKKYGFTSFMWYDDEINISIDRLKKLCEKLSERDYQHRGFVRSDMIVKHPESVQWMKKAGFVKLCTGVESGSGRILDIINKKTTPEENSKARKIIKDAGIHYEAFTILGHPSETLEDVEMTKQWLIDNKPDDFDINLLTPYPGSKIYDEAVPSDKYEGYEWEYKGLYFNKPDYSKDESYYKGLDKQSMSNIRTDEITHDEFVRLRNEIDEEVRTCIK